MAQAFIGTSGWHYRHWKGTFYPADIKEKEQFAYYRKFFNTVELNNSFYMLPAETTFENWRKAAPGNFIFAVKASRYITHIKKLNDAEMALKRLLEHASVLKKKLGPILFQLPPGWGVNEERLESFLKILPPGHRYTFEFRNPEWYTDNVFDLLHRHNCAFCIYELAGHLSPEAVTADFVYVRLHGPGAKYSGSYSDKSLRKWAAKCKVWIKKKKDVYVYFDNDQLGYAAFNAKKLKEMAEK